MSGCFLYQDEDLLAIHKPPGIVVHQGLPQETTSCVSQLQKQLKRSLYPTHRLDRATSGVLVVAMHASAARGINAQFAERKVKKQYFAVVSGVPPETDELHQPLTRSARHHNNPDFETLPSHTSYRRIATTGEVSVLLVQLHTGRQHQIRRHMRAIGHPVVGDKRYGHGRQNRRWRIEAGFHRLGLHAMALSLEHPISGAPLEFLAPLPEDLLAPLRRLGFSSAQIDGKSLLLGCLLQKTSTQTTP